jgi:hypothetical protein
MFLAFNGMQGLKASQHVLVVNSEANPMRMLAVSTCASSFCNIVFFKPPWSGLVKSFNR